VHNPNPRNPKADKAGLVPGSHWLFCYQKLEMYIGNYYKVFHSNNYMKW
jgi:hypothetical protein